MDSSDKQTLKYKLLEEVHDSHCKRLRPTFTSFIVQNLSHLDSLDHPLLNHVIKTFVKLCKITKHGTYVISLMYRIVSLSLISSKNVYARKGVSPTLSKNVERTLT